MITIRLMGGLGNQMFQYAAARSLAERQHSKLALDLSWFDQDFDVESTARKYELDCFRLDQSTQKFAKGLIGRLTNKFSQSYNEPHFHYDENFFSLASNATLSGYFQSEKYFSEIRPRLLADFHWVRQAEGINKDLVKNLEEDTKSVSVHVRRGDYVTNAAAAKTHGLAGVAYYRKAVELISKDIPQPNLYVFSDDPDWCKKHLTFKQPTIYIAHNTDGAEDLRLMRLCRHNVIANSSFSWWGAWLNENPDKQVIAPQAWFANAEHSTKDLIPSSWRQI